MTAPRIPRRRVSIANLFVYIIEPIVVLCLIVVGTIAACTGLTGCGGGGDSGTNESATERAAHEVPTPHVDCSANPKACI